MALQIDLEKDFAEVLRNRLLAKGYPPRTETDEETISRYLNVLNRKIEPKARATKRPTTLAVPPEHQAGFDALIRTSESGGDLRPYQSTGLEKDQYDDGMLNAWNLHHFHLGTGPHPRFPGYVSRTGPLPYAVVTNDTLYCLGIYDHGGWSMQPLLEIVDRDFPELSEPSTLTNNKHVQVVGMRRNYTDEEVQKLRDAGINALTMTPGGNILGPMGGGVNLNKKKGQKSLKVAKANIDVRKVLKELGEEIDSQADAAGVPNGHAASLIEENGKLLVVDATRELTVTIDTAIVKPL
jgi:hypothetical protein